MEHNYKYMFGPVPSRRLGRSLGVDLVPFKTCSFNCVYCQLGRTPQVTAVRKEYVPLEKVVAEIKQKLTEGEQPDYITMSGSGEPTLYSRLGELIAAIKSFTKIPVAVLTNSSLLWQETVRQEIMDADLVVPSLDAGSEELFRHVNRGCPEITFSKMLVGLEQFAREYHGKMWLEVFLLSGITAIEAEVKKIAEITARIKPEKVQLNTVARPPAESFSEPVEKLQLEKFVPLFGKTPVEIIADFNDTHKIAEYVATGEDVESMLKRRPCSQADISDGLHLHPNETGKYLGHLLDENKIASIEKDGVIYYQAVR